MNKKRNSGHSETITPWRVSSNQDNNYKTYVPINATLIGSVATIVVTLGVIFRSLFSESTTILAMITLVAGMLQIPLVLAFTIKHQNKTSKINPVVPKTLQFHDGSHDSDNDIINCSNEGNYEATENGRHPVTTVVELHDSTENIDKADENGDDSCEYLELAASSKQIHSTDTSLCRERNNSLPGEVCSNLGYI